jgi:altronate dehydratase large subunit
MTPLLEGWLRSDGRKGIRNTVQVVFLVECAHHVARAIATPFAAQGVQLIGFGGCYPNAYAQRVLERLCTHPNAGAALLVSLGCEGFDRSQLLASVRESGRPAAVLSIQQEGGTAQTIQRGRQWIESVLPKIAAVPRTPLALRDLIVGTVCGGSDAFSGITANPSVGLCFDRLVAEGAACIFEETGELIGCEQIMAARAVTPALGSELTAVVHKAARYYTTLGHGSFAPGNADGGLTTQEEKSMGAYAKSGSSPIRGILKPGDLPKCGGLFLLDIVPDGDVRFGFPNINDSVEIIELISCGAHLILFTTGRGSVVGAPIAPVIKVCANPETYRRMRGDMDVDAGRIAEGRATLAEVGDEIFHLVRRVAAGEMTCSEALGHQEFVLGYKSFEPAGPACFPG